MRIGIPRSVEAPPGPPHGVQGQDSPLAVRYEVLRNRVGATRKISSGPVRGVGVVPVRGWMPLRCLLGISRRARLRRLTRQQCRFGRVNVRRREASDAELKPAAVRGRRSNQALQGGRQRGGRLQAGSCPVAVVEVCRFRWSGWFVAVPKCTSPVTPRVEMPVAACGSHLGRDFGLSRWRMSSRWEGIRRSVVCIAQMRTGPAAEPLFRVLGQELMHGRRRPAPQGRSRRGLFLPATRTPGAAVVLL